MKTTLDKIFDCLQDNGNNVTSGIVLASVTNSTVNQLINLTKKHVLLEGIQYISDNCKSIEEIDCALFDIVLKEYVWHMGYTYLDEAIYHRRPLYYTLKALWQSITTEQKFLNVWGVESNKPYCKIPIILSTFIYTILTNLYKEEQKISKEEYEKLLKRYNKRTHVEYENIVAPLLHPYASVKLIEMSEKRQELENYYTQKYSNFPLLKFNTRSDAIRQFYETRDIMPIGDDSAYLIN